MECDANLHQTVGCWLAVQVIHFMFVNTVIYLYFVRRRMEANFNVESRFVLIVMLFVANEK